MTRRFTEPTPHELALAGVTYEEALAEARELHARCYCWIYKEKGKCSICQMRDAKAKENPMSSIPNPTSRPAVTKFCKDCQYLKPDTGLGLVARCDHPTCLQWLKDTATLNPVNGELFIAPAHCGYLRALAETPCGPPGRLFKRAECAEGEHDWEHSFAFDVCTKCGKKSAEA